MPAIIGRYTGPAYSFGPDPVTSFGPKDDVAVILTSVVNIITTPKGSVAYAPDLGSMVPYLLFDQNDEVTQNLIRYFTIKDLIDQEPRINVLACYTREVDPHTIVVTVAFQIVGDASGKVYLAPVSFSDNLGA
jgi:phage baseplate assembly protein W